MSYKAAKNRQVLKQLTAAALVCAFLIGAETAVPLSVHAEAVWANDAEGAPQPIEESALLWLPVSYTLTETGLTAVEADGVVTAEGVTLSDGSALVTTVDGVRVASVPPKDFSGVLYAPSRLLARLFGLNISQTKDGVVKVSRVGSAAAVDDSWYYDWAETQTQTEEPAPQTPSEAVRKNVLNSLYNSSGKPDSILALMDRDGSFKDLDYANQDMNDWHPGKHLSRMETLTAICYTPTNPLYKDPDLMAKVVLGIEYWFKGNFVGSAWWNNRGVPMSCQNLSVFPIEGLSETTAAEMKRRCKGYDESSDHFFTYGGEKKSGTLRNYYGTGQGVPSRVNASMKLIAAAGDSMTEEEKEKTIADCVKGLNDELTVKPYAVGYSPTGSTADMQSIKPDYSYHEHSNCNLTCTYGSAFLNDLYSSLVMLSGSGYNLSEEAAVELRNLLLDGFRYMYKNNYILQSASGRQPALPSGASLTSLTIRSAKIYFCEYLLRHYPDMDRRAELIDYRNMTVSTQVNGNFSGTRYFWHSDFLAHNRPSYLFAVNAVSNRLRRPEKANDSNLLAAYEGDGFYEILKRGNEYAGLYPVYDWWKLAGVTAAQDQTFDLNPQSQEKGTTTFCGGVSDGQYGFSVYDLDHFDVIGKKSWFCFDDEIVCLGAGITSANSNPVFTGVNQTRLWDEVSTDGGTVTAEQNEALSAKWVLHDGVGYVFEGTESLTLNQGAQTGAWGLVNNEESMDDVVTENVFLLGINHGIKPQNASYAYAILPDTDAAQLTSYVASRPYDVISNTADCQAVYHKTLNILQAVFYKPGSVSAPNGQTIRVDQPCAVMLRCYPDGSYQLSAANPEFKKLRVQVSCSGPVSATIAFDLQEGFRGNDSGKTVIYDSKTADFLPDNNLIREQIEIEEPAALWAVSVNGTVYSEKAFFNTRRVRSMTISELPEIKAKGNYPATIETDDEKTVITIAEEGNPENKAIYLIEYTWKEQNEQ